MFLYDGRDGVVTDTNGLLYMRARYYSPEMRRFINADIVPGKISNAVTLNRFAYANGNPVSFVDPFGLSPDDRNSIIVDYVDNISDQTSSAIGYLDAGRKTANALLNQNDPLKLADDIIGDSSKIAKNLEVAGYVADVAAIVVDTGVGVVENIQNDEPVHYIIADAYVDIQFGAAGMAVGMLVGSVLPGAGTAAGAVVGFLIGSFAGTLFDIATEGLKIFGGKSLKDAAKDTARDIADFLKFW